MVRQEGKIVAGGGRRTHRQSRCPTIFRVGVRQRRRSHSSITVPYAFWSSRRLVGGAQSATVTKVDSDTYLSQPSRSVMSTDPAFDAMEWGAEVSLLTARSAERRASETFQASPTGGGPADTRSVVRGFEVVQNLCVYVSSVAHPIP